jgi:hypothetical protein
LDALRQLAEDMTAKDLERHMRVKKPLGNIHRGRLHFSPKHNAEF